MRTILSYERFERHIRAWRDREIMGLLVVGPPGMGKTRTYDKLLSDTRHHLFRGRVSGIQCFITLHDNPTHCPIVFDDVSTMLRDRQMIDIMKQLCDS